jgi:hypothetical protein
MARNMSYKAIEKDLLHNSKIVLLHMVLGSLHAYTMTQLNTKACLPLCAYIKPSTACLSLQEFQPTQRTTPQNSPFPLAGARVRKRSSFKGQTNKKLIASIPATVHSVV